MGRSAPQRKGLAYERAVGRQAMAYFGACWLGAWFEFKDANGRGFCQPDVVIARGDQIYVLEVKLSECPQGTSQLEELYLPVLRHFYGPLVWGIQVAKYLRPQSRKEMIRLSLEEAFEAALEGGTPILHWPGRGAL